jgi:hypothetical protein
LISALLRLFVLRPLLSVAILGFPILLLIVVGLFTMVLLKFLLFVVLPVGLVLWLLRRLFRSDGPAES